MTIRDQSLHILQHALGLDDYGRGESYRNHFVAGEGSDDWAMLQEHVAAGRMIEHAPREIFGGGSCFTVTDAGREYVRANSPAPPKKTRAQKRYLAWLDADDGRTFGEWMRGEP